MTKEEYLSCLYDAYSPASVLSDKNGCKVLKLKNKLYDGYIVARVYPKSIPAYEELYRIKCENLPLIWDVIDLDDGQIVLEEFIEGITVHQVMESGRYQYAGAKKILRSVCHALEVLHSRGIVHRDIKPENIIISDSGRVVLIDLNAARMISSSSRDTVIMGTVGYASPEQLGVSQSDSRTDIYAMGVLLNVMLTGLHPSEKLASGKGGRIVRKCTGVNPDQRYPSAEKLAKAL